MDPVGEAKAYQKLSKPQYDIGRNFTNSLGLRPGNKVLDMGCGTGELTKLIAEQVGTNGEVVGVDPNEERIKLAQQAFHDVPGLRFELGESVAGFSHDNDEYYDVHFSNNSFHWQKRENMPSYVEKAYTCLKPGGVIAIQTGLPCPHLPMPRALQSSVVLLEEDELKDLVRWGKFKEVKSKVFDVTVHFASNDEFLMWFRASVGQSFQNMGQDYVKNFRSQLMTTEPDGGIRIGFENAVQITARK